MISLEAFVRNYNVLGVGRLLGCGASEEELEAVMKKMGIPIVVESKRDQLLRSLEEWRRGILGQEHLGHNRPKPLAEMLAERNSRTKALG